MALTLDTVRQHLRLDSNCEDAALMLYTRAAIEAAERYTARKLRSGSVTQVIENPEAQSYRLDADPSGGVVARVTLASGRQIQRMARVAGDIAMLTEPLGCDAVLLELIYNVGPADAMEQGVLVDADPMIELGMLKFAAYAYAHRGDDPNCWLSDSGAMSLWQPYRKIGF